MLCVPCRLGSSSSPLHSTPRNSYNMLLWRMCRLFMRLRERALGAAASSASAADPAAPVTGTMASQPLTTKNELRGLALRIARVVAMMNRYGYRVTPQSGAMLQVSYLLRLSLSPYTHPYRPSSRQQHDTAKKDVAAATTDFGFFRVLEDKLTEMCVRLRGGRPSCWSWKGEKRVHCLDVVWWCLPHSLTPRSSSHQGDADARGGGGLRPLRPSGRTERARQRSPPLLMMITGADGVHPSVARPPGVIGGGGGGSGGRNAAVCGGGCGWYIHRRARRRRLQAANRGGGSNLL